MTPSETLKRYFGYDSFRGIQEDIINSILAGHDTLGLMPTGGGKSITFQVPALMMDGVCIVVTPLIALMKDQVMHLKKRNIRAEAIYSGLTKREIQRILDNTIYGAVKFLYISPERIHTELFQAKLYYMKVCLITVDEAHCISQWGYDFRPSYLNISKLRTLKPDAPVLALTATATPAVISDIQTQLAFRTIPGHSDPTLSDNVFRMSFARPNISFVVRKTEDIYGEMLHILQSVEGSAIVYVQNREETRQISDSLNRYGISATYYHAAVDFNLKTFRQEQWQHNNYRVMVTTNAFGMGIDKPDVRLVIHVSIPSSLEEYYQEAGRAGRDGKRSYAALLYDPETLGAFHSRVNMSYPPKEFIREVYDDLAYFFQLAEDSGQGARYEFNLDLFCHHFHHFPSSIPPVLQILENAGYITYDPEPDSDARIIFNASREDLYNIHYLSRDEDMMINVLLRYYGCLFTETTYISTPLLCEKLHIDNARVHLILKSLSEKNIIRYIPKRSVPIITYTQQRINSSRLRFPDNIYKTLAKRMSQRIKAVDDYISSSECRQQVLLQYFGEKSTTPCHHCDNCLNQ